MWVWMFITNLIIPLTMIGFGSMFVKRAPKKINMLFGYRTSWSMKNEDTWTFAHQHCGKLWRVIGWILLALSVLVMLPVIGKDADLVGTVGSVVLVVEIVVLLGSILPTEIALKKHFDAYGNRK